MSDEIGLRSRTVVGSVLVLGAVLGLAVIVLAVTVGAALGGTGAGARASAFPIAMAVAASVAVVLALFVVALTVGAAVVPTPAVKALASAAAVAILLVPWQLWTAFRPVEDGGTARLGALYAFLGIVAVAAVAALAAWLLGQPVDSRGARNALSAAILFGVMPGLFVSLAVAGPAAEVGAAFIFIAAAAVAAASSGVHGPADGLAED
ncbi:hypothetical protein [Gordonia araii]|uniref:hypothetical protein n=1 Tax=Gordonia araii TaxID=263909 RepID=UPI0011100CD0|nr:hypothetical protein [Gordonia araii]NNG98651.1 hypothetical protein [Gordonia araii NBRC 100433]